MVANAKALALPICRRLYYDVHFRVNVSVMLRRLDYVGQQSAVACWEASGKSAIPESKKAKVESALGRFRGFRVRGESGQTLHRLRCRLASHYLRIALTPRRPQT
jgi:hypothetical protein